MAIQITLLEHRQNLNNNPSATTEHISQCYKTVVKHLKDAGFTHITYNRAQQEIEEFVNLIFKSQDSKPFLDIGGELPYYWNQPKNWNINYVKYEWGHLLSRNQGGAAAHNIENLCLQSARCNQHIQSSMNIRELRHYGGKLKQVIDKNLKAREALFKTTQWRELLVKLKKINDKFSK